MSALLQSDRFLRSVIRPLVSEEEALEAVDRLMKNTSGESGGHGLRAAIARVGLLGIATPAAFGGADVTNATLAEIVQRLAAETPQEASRLVSHFVANEIVRNATGNPLTVFQRVAGGSRLVAVVPGAGDGFGAGNDYEPHAVAEGEDVWFVVLRFADDTVASVHVVRNARPAADTLDGSFLEIDTDALQLVGALASLLDAGIFLGAIDRSKRSLPPGVTTDNGAEGTAKALMIVFETVSALIQRAGSALDVAQIRPSRDNIAEAARLADVLQHVQARFAAEYSWQESSL